MIEDLQLQLNDQLRFFKTEISNIPLNSLKFKPEKNKWSVLDCIEHLNMVFDVYLPRIKKGVKKANKNQSESYKPGFFGERMVQAMLPKKNTVTNPMRTFSNMDPHKTRRPLTQALTEFERNMLEFQSLIDSSEKIDLGKIRIKSAIGIILRFKLGDCYRFLLAHNQRHFVQIKKTMRVLATYQ